MASTPRPTTKQRSGSTAQSQGQETDARRPPELSTRDNVARAIYTEVKEGRGSPHGGVSTSTSATCPRTTSAASCPRCTSSSRSSPRSTSRPGRWRSGRRPTTSWAASGSIPRPAPRPCPGCSPPARSPAVCMGRTDSGATRCRTSWSSGRAPAPAAAADARRGSGGVHVDPVQVQAALRALDAPLERTGGEDPYAIQRDLQDVMQRLVGIYRVDEDLERRSTRSPCCASAGRRPA